MPLSGKDREVEKNFEREYPGRAKEVFYRTLNKKISSGRTPNLPEARRLAKKRKVRRKGGKKRKMR